MVFSIIMKVFAGAVTVLSIVVLIYVYTVPLDSMRMTRDGVPYFTPQVINPENGEPIDMGKLIRHYRGD